MEVTGVEFEYIDSYRDFDEYYETTCIFHVQYETSCYIDGELIPNGSDEIHVKAIIDFDTETEEIELDEFYIVRP